jgi:hypothetical protein
MPRRPAKLLKRTLPARYALPKKLAHTRLRSIAKGSSLSFAAPMGGRQFAAKTAFLIQLAMARPISVPESSWM